MFFHQYSFWICIGALCGFAVLFNTLCVIALTYLRAPQKAHGNVASAPADDSRVHARRDSSPTFGLPNGTPERRMVLPLQPLTLTFKHINYFVDTPPEMKKYGIKEKRIQLLKDVSGAFRPDSLTALMGVTGAGKTTLMDVLAGRKTGGHIEGSIKVSGYPKKQETFARVFGYCEQNDIHSPYITIHESFLFSAWLRLPPEISSETRTRFVDEVMELVELKGMKCSLVGVPDLFGLTTDQRKRLNIAVELVSNPSVIFMDEPTTGLDTPAATIVMRAMRNTVDTGRTVVCTIHQPNTEIFESFDEAIPGVPKMRSGSSPSAWMLDVTSTDMEFDLGIDFAEYYQRSPLYK
ncbi:putative ABC transporter ATP-binding protein [Nymphaea thermarum]|nr:putative ABC transporter ATP-binding protein [Nymphaea thermarum]